MNPSKSFYSEQEAADALNMTVEELTACVRRHIDAESPLDKVTYRPSDLLLLSLLAGKQPLNPVPPKAGRIRILLADDHTLFRRGVRTLLTSEVDFEVCGEAATAEAAVQEACILKPALVVMDVGMPGLSAFAATLQIRQQCPDTRILFLTMYDDEDYLVEAMEAGASGYVLKDSPSAQLATAVRSAVRGETYVSPRILSHMIDDLRTSIRSAGRAPRFATLTTREREVLRMLAEGESMKEIACDLNLSLKTVASHRYNLMRKLDLHNKTQIIQYAVQKRIILLPR